MQNSEKKSFAVDRTFFIHFECTQFECSGKTFECDNLIQLCVKTLSFPFMSGNLLSLFTQEPQLPG